TDRKRRDAGLPARDPAGDWAVGQVATLRAALDLLADRAQPPPGAPQSPPWPEFTEYACFACHHALVDERLHYSRRAPVPGSLAWASWTLPMARALIDQANPPLIGPLDAVEQRMHQPLPDQARVAEDARGLADQL